jgi:hypothetical protein
MGFSRSILAALTIALLGLPAVAAPSTSQGRISVAQVMELLDKAGSKPEATQLLTAYLAGVGETAGILLAATRSDGTPYASCTLTPALDANGVRAALRAGAPNRKSWAETPATPIVVAKLIDAAGCR